MSVSPPPRRTTRGDKFVGSSDEEFCNEPPQLRKKVYRKKKSTSDSASEGLDSGLESGAASPKSPSSCASPKTPKSRRVQKTSLFKNAVRSVVQQANVVADAASSVRDARKESAIHRQTREPEKNTTSGRRLPSATELASHFGGRDFGEYDSGSVTVVRQYGIDLFSLK